GRQRPGRARGQLLPAQRRYGRFKRRPQREGAAADRGRWAAAGDGGRGARDARRAQASGGRSGGVNLPLEGVRILDLSRLLPGGFCSLLLADLGAEVLKVEDTGMGDYVRWAPPYHAGVEESARSALFLALNRNKRSIRIDLKTDGGPDLLPRLARE